MNRQRHLGFSPVVVSKNRHSAFTLVELLVVITIIGMLVALLLPAVNSARESARQTTCMNNQRNFGEAIQQYVTSKDYFPGYRQPLTQTSGSKIVVNWQIVLWPNMGKSDVYQAVQSGSLPTLPYMEFSLCPSDNSISGKSAPWTSYVANTGRLDTVNTTTGVVNVADYRPFVAESGANGIFQDRVVTNVKLSLTDIKDGQGTTLMLSENVDAAYYNDGPGSDNPSFLPLTTSGPPASWPVVWAGQVSANNAVHNCSERGAGFVWWDTSKPSSSSAQPSNAPDYAVEAINGKAGDYDPVRLGWPSSPYDITPPTTTGTPTTNSNFAARPSSNHPGGVIVTFAGGNTRFLREDIDYPVYCLLMTPNGANSPTKSTNGATPPKSWQLAYPLDEGKL